MIKLVIFESADTNAEIAINPEHVEAIEDHGRYSEITMASGRKHAVKKHGDRSVRDWLTGASIELKRLREEKHPLRETHVKPGGTD